MRVPTLLAFAAIFCATLARAGDTSDLPALPGIGSEPVFTLASQDGSEVGLASLRGEVVLFTFIYTWCHDICPLLKEKMARVQDDLGASFSGDVALVSITVGRAKLQQNLSKLLAKL